MRFYRPTASQTCRKVNVSVGGTLEATDVVVDGSSFRDRVFDLEQENQVLRSDVETLKEQNANVNETLRFVLSVLTPATDSPTTLTTTETPPTTAELEVYEGSLSTDDGSFSEAICEQFKTGEHRNVGYITGNVYIRDQSWLRDMSCFQNIREIGGYLAIYNNAALTNVDGLSR